MWNGYDVIIPEGTNSTFDNDYMTGEVTVKYYNEDIWEGLVDFVTVEEACKIIKENKWGKDNEDS